MENDIYCTKCHTTASVSLCVECEGYGDDIVGIPCGECGGTGLWIYCAKCVEYIDWKEVLQRQRLGTRSKYVVDIPSL